MLKSYKSTLNLHSYKIDTKGFEEKIKQFSIEQSQLKSIINNYKHQESVILEENKNLKYQNYQLKNRFRQETEVIQKQTQKCSNCKHLEHSINKLSKELQSQRLKTREFKQMYDNEVANKNEVTQFYEKKLDVFKRDKDQLVRSYEEKIKKAMSKNSFNNLTKIIDSTTSLKNDFGSNRYVEDEMPIESNQVVGVNVKNEQKWQKMNNLPPTPSKSRSMNMFKQEIDNYALSMPPQQNLIRLLRPISENLKQMQVTFEELKVIPIVIKFINHNNPPLNKFINLMRDFPFDSENQDLIEKAYANIQDYLSKSNQKPTGTIIFDFIISKIQEIRMKEEKG